MAGDSVEINRAPVLTLWIAVVAEHLGHDWNSALTIGKVFAGLNAQAKGKALGIFSEPKGTEGAPRKKSGLGEESWIHISGRGIPVKTTEAGVRAVVRDKTIEPESVKAYLSKAFGENLGSVREAMIGLSGAYPAQEIEPIAFGLYEKFRPKIASGQRGWGQKGTLDLDLIRRMAANRA